MEEKRGNLSRRTERKLEKGKQKRKENKTEKEIKAENGIEHLLLKIYMYQLMLEKKPYYRPVRK